MEKIDLYTIDDDYVVFLKKFDNKVMNNTDPKYKKNRPYVGIITTIESSLYFIPLSSKEKKVNSKISTKIHNNSNNTFAGVIKYNNMIPVNIKNVKILSLKDLKKQNDIKYYELVTEQRSFIHKNSEVILSKAKNVYNKKINNKLGALGNVCCDFKLLEEKCIEYNKLINKQKTKIKM